MKNQLLLRVLLLVFGATLLPAAEDNPDKVPPSKSNDVDKFNEDYIVLTRTLMNPKNVSDTFGRRIARRYIAMQITVTNRNPDFQWLISDASIDLSRLIAHMSVACAPRVSSLRAITQQVNVANLTPKYASDGALQRPKENLISPNVGITGSDLTVLRGVAEKGQYLDPRNLSLRMLRSSGTVAAGLLGVTTFGPAFAPAVAAFNGPLVSAFELMFPDQTVNQMNRLNDSAYAANTIVPKQAAKVLVVFIPATHLLNQQEQAIYFKNAHSIYENTCIDLRLLDAIVDGHYITKLNLQPQITSVSIPSAEAAKFSTDDFKITGAILGHFLTDAELSLADAPAGLTLANSNASADRIEFILGSVKPIAPNTLLNFRVQKGDYPPTTVSLAVAYTPVKPSIAVDGLDVTSLKQGEVKPITLKGTGFMPGASVVFTNSDGLSVGDVKFKDSTELQFSITALADAVPGPRIFVVANPGGLSSGQKTISIEKK